MELPALRAAMTSWSVTPFESSRAGSTFSTMVRWLPPNGGGADTDGVLTNRSLRRVIRGISLYEGAFAPLLVLSGSADETRSRMALAQGLGVPGSAILTAGQAHTTREEAEQLGELLLPLGRRRILLVADPIDMPRSRALMERAGFVVRPAPTAAGGPSNPEARLGLVRDIAIELTAWAYYRLRGLL